MDIKILNIKFNLSIEDLIYMDSSRERIITMRGYSVEFYLNRHIRSTIEIETDRELTIDEIKQKIREACRNTVVEGE